MLILSRNNLNELADSIIQDFYKEAAPCSEPIDIDRLATDYLGLEVHYEDLSSNGSILGVTAYAPCTLKLGNTTINLKANSVLLDSSLSPSKCKIQAVNGRRRFTLAHECAHQILYRYESAISQAEIRQRYACRKIFSLRELKTNEDWNEWQANALGAALLMPESLVREILHNVLHSEKIIRYGNWLPPIEYTCIGNMSKLLEVSHSALQIRLQHLGYLETRDKSEYDNHKRR